MDPIEYIFIALLQGLAEWLPISSEGQLMLFLNFASSINPYEAFVLVIWLHVGTAASVVARYPKEILNIISLKNKFDFQMLLIATIATAISGIPMYMFLESFITNTQGEILNLLIGVLLIITGIILGISAKKINENSNVNGKIMFITGLMQGFAILPGISRSGVTVAALLLQKIEKETALKYSFLMSIPAIFGAFFFENIKVGFILPGEPIFLGIAELVAFVVGFITMTSLLRVAKNIDFSKFCIFMGLIAVLIYPIGILFG